HAVRLDDEGGTGKIEPFVEHVVLEGGHAVPLHERGYLPDLRAQHRSEVVSEVDARAAGGGVEHLREDVLVGAALVEVVMPRSEVADDARHTPDEGRERLRRRVLPDVSVDAEMEVGIDGAGDDEQSSSVDHLIRVGDVLGLADRGDPAAADADRRAHGSPWKRHYSVEHGHFVLRHLVPPCRITSAEVAPPRTLNRLAQTEPRK